MNFLFQSMLAGIFFHPNEYHATIISTSITRHARLIYFIDEYTRLIIITICMVNEGFFFEEIIRGIFIFLGKD